MQPERGIATMTTAACGRNRESLLGPWPARRERRPRREADAGSHNPAGGGRPQAAKKSPVGSFLVFGSQSSGMSTVVAAVWAHMREGVFLFDPYGNQ